MTGFRVQKALILQALKMQVLIYLNINHSLYTTKERKIQYKKERYNTRIQCQQFTNIHTNKGKIRKDLESHMHLF